MKREEVGAEEIIKGQNTKILHKEKEMKKGKGKNLWLQVQKNNL